MFVEPSVSLASARELMGINGVDSLAVVDNKGKLVGFFAERQAKAHFKTPSQIKLILN